MYIALISIILFVCVILVLVVLSQNAKGGGLSSQFGGGGTNQLMGVKRTGDLLEKLTWSLAVALMVLTLSSHMMLDTQPVNVPGSVIEERARLERQAPTSPNLPSTVDSIPVAPIPEAPVAPIPEANEVPAPGAGQ
jgi:preprotein translocase subunit SecG